MEGRRRTATLQRTQPFFLYEGSIEFNAAKKTHVVSAGEAIFVPRGIAHSYRNVGEGNALMYAIYTPAGMEGWFREVFERVRPGESQAPPPADEAMIARMSLQMQGPASTSSGSRSS